MNEMTLVNQPEPTAPGTSIVEEVDKDGNKVISFDAIFPTLIGSIKLPEIPIGDIAKKAVEFASHGDNYEGGWTSYFTQTDISVIPGMDLVAQAALGVAAAYARELKLDVDPAKGSLQMWVSVIRKNGYHGIHSHPGSVVSGTFYVQCDSNSGPLVLLNPTRHMRNHEPKPGRQEDLTAFTSERMNIQIEPGKMVVWPSWLEHHVMRHEDDKDRIAISFNVDYPFFDRK